MREPNEPEPVEAPSRPTIIALLSGPSIWFGHFIGVYLLAEVACQFSVLGGDPQAGGTTLGSGGLPLVSIVVLAATVVALATLAVAAWQTVAYRREGGGDDLLLVVGLGLDALFAFAVLATGLPVLVLQPC
jgi:hypothetical protein